MRLFSTKTTIRRLTVIIIFPLIVVVSGCSSEALTSPYVKKHVAPEVIAVPSTPANTLRPESSHWGGVVIDSPNGKLLAAALHTDNTMGVWHIDRNRSIREVGQVAVGFHPDAVTTMGNDVVAVAVEGAGKISFWRISETQLPVAVGEVPSPFPTRDIVSYDLDGDGKLDLVLSPYSGEKIAILWGEGGLRFSTPQWLEAAATPWHPRVVDWNGDARPDLVWSDMEAGSARLYVNHGKRQFKLKLLQRAERGSPRQLGVGDVDGDEKPDAVMAMSTSKMARILYNRGDLPPKIEDVPAPIWGYVGAEVMRDGTLVLSEEQRIILARKEQGNWVYRTHPAGSLPSPILLTDLDEDGQQDLVVFNSASNGTTVIYGSLWETATPFTMPAINLK